MYFLSQNHFFNQVLIQILKARLVPAVNIAVILCFIDLVSGRRQEGIRRIQREGRISSTLQFGGRPYVCSDRPDAEPYHFPSSSAPSASKNRPFCPSV